MRGSLSAVKKLEFRKNLELEQTQQKTNAMGRVAVRMIMYTDGEKFGVSASGDCSSARRSVKTPASVSPVQKAATAAFSPLSTSQGSVMNCAR